MMGQETNTRKVRPLRDPVALQPATGQGQENGLNLILQRHTAAKKRIANLTRILRKIEWMHYEDDDGADRFVDLTICPYCQAWPEDGHHAYCELAKALREENGERDT